MHVFLIVVMYWDMAYRGQQATPIIVKEMPTFAACWAAGKAIKSMDERSDFRCIKTPSSGP